MTRAHAVAVTLLALAIVVLACGAPRRPSTLASTSPSRPESAPLDRPASSSDGQCQNDLVVLSPTILVFAPHPDDEILGFSGVIRAAQRQGKDVRVVVVTNGQGHCEGCVLWKRAVPVGSPGANPCTRTELDEFGFHRHRESLAALAVLGVPAGHVTFLDYEAPTLSAAWGDPIAVPRSKTCIEGESMPAGRRTKTGNELSADLAAILARHPAATTLFTTHPLDGHGDHSALYRFLRRAVQDAGSRRRIYTAVIHDRRYDSCAYPNPRADPSLCAPRPSSEQIAASPTSIAAMREERYRPDTAWSPPRDAAYGDPLVFCLERALFEGGDALKRRAIERHETQIGMTDASGHLLPEPYRGWVDRSGFLLSFVHTNELFYPDPPVPPGPPSPPPLRP